ncbi:MAG: hypothetical protein LBJ95_05320, partial [Oscillospiraceae bacterium]|nr:hypothetical protein [Oscillospiraceae bacterium]
NATNLQTHKNKTEWKCILMKFLKNLAVSTALLALLQPCIPASVRPQKSHAGKYRTRQAQ